MTSSDQPDEFTVAAIGVVQHLLQQQVAETRRTRESIAFMAEEAAAARRLAQHGSKSLTQALAQVYSQNYEDAMIAEVFRRIGTQDRSFIEIGVEDGGECNTRLLLQLGWRGLWIEGSEAHCATIRTRFAREIAAGQLTLQHAFLTRENINATIAAAGFTQAVDFLSVDVDMNTHHLWRALSVPARVACIEYNASYPPSVAFELPYAPHSMWDGSNWFGASLKVLEGIGREKDMLLVGCDLSGVNAFFVAADAAGDKFAAPYDAETHFEPARYNVLKTRGHKRAP